MKNIFIINGAMEYAHSKGELNNYIVNEAQNILLQRGFSTKITHVKDRYSPLEEVEKFLWADIIIYQFPMWWMSAPWILKKYIDEVLTQGHGKLYASDGRLGDNPKSNYGKGGLLHGKKYMLSITANAPIEAFVEKDEFFNGVGVDNAFISFHKTNQFLAMEKINTFIFNDVMKNPTIEKDMVRYKEHLIKNI